MISPYRQNESATMPSREASALNWYTAEVAREVANRGWGVSVVAPRVEGDRREVWTDGSIRIVPTYRRGDPLAVAQIGREVLRAPGTVVHLQHELFAYGGVASAFAVPWMLRALRARSRRVVTTMHGIIPLDRMDSAFIRSNGIQAPLRAVRAGWRQLVRQCCDASDVVHVHEREHEHLLRSQYAYHGRLVVRPMGSRPANEVRDPRDARRRLSLDGTDHVVLFFGFLLERKGVVPLLTAARRILAADPSLTIVVAGDVPARLGENTAVRRLVDDLRDESRVRFLGFVPDEEIDDVFAAADAVIFPYTISIAASGPLAHAVGHGVPVLLSTAFGSSFTDAPLTFEPTADGIADSIARFFNDPLESDRAYRYVTKLRSERTWPSMAQWLDELYASL